MNGTVTVFERFELMLTRRRTTLPKIIRIQMARRLQMLKSVKTCQNRMGTFFGEVPLYFLVFLRSNSLGVHRVPDFLGKKIAQRKEDWLLAQLAELRSEKGAFTAKQRELVFYGYINVNILLQIMKL